MNIGSVPVGPGHPAYLIAEIGGNHDGQLDQAQQLIRHAANAGADAAKFQLFRPEKLYPGHITPGTIRDEWLPELKAGCHEAGIEFICSVFCQDTLDAYMQVDPAAVKIASPEATNLGFVRACAKTGLPHLISTGAMTWQQVAATRRAFVHATAYGHAEYVLLHCVSAYPASPFEMNLAAITEMGVRFLVPVGLSDHTLDDHHIPALAIAAGANLIEKHLTHNRNAPGADHPFALEPDEFAYMVATIRETETIMGDGVKRPMPSEDPTDRRAAA